MNRVERDKLFFTEAKRQIDKLKSDNKKMLEALKWLVNAMSDGSLQVFTDDDDHKAVRDDNQDHINEIEALVKELE